LFRTGLCTTDGLFGNGGTIVKRSLGDRIVLFLLEVTKPLLLPIFWIVHKTFTTLLRPMSLRMTREDDDQFGHDIQSNLGFLFAEYGGELRPIPVKEPSPFDYAVNRVVFPEFTLQFIRGRGGFRVRVAPVHAPKALEDLPVILSVIDDGFERREFKSFSDLETVLRPRMKLLQEALSPDRYPELLRRLANVHEHDRAIIRQWETEINRRLYPDR
jgi:hypothetical protein